MGRSGRHTRSGRLIRPLYAAVAVGAIAWVALTVLATLVATGDWVRALQEVVLSISYRERPEIPDRILLAAVLGVLGFIGRVVALGSVAILLASRALLAASAYRARLLGLGPAASSSR